MPTDLQTRAQHLALAEFCQRVISPLWDFVDGKAKLPAETLGEAQTALLSVKSGSPYRFGQRPFAALGSYEQVCTLEEAWRTPQEIDEVLRLTAKLIEEHERVSDKSRGEAEELIRLFAKLQKKALWNFEQAKRSAPPDVGELCRALAKA